MSLPVPFSSPTVVSLVDVDVLLQLVLLEKLKERLVTSETNSDTRELIVIPVRGQNSLNLDCTLSERNAMSYRTLAADKRAVRDKTMRGLFGLAVDAESVVAVCH